MVNFVVKERNKKMNGESEAKNRSQVNWSRVESREISWGRGVVVRESIAGSALLFTF